MTRARLVLLLGSAAAAAAGCGGKSSSPERANLRLPSSVAFFEGRTVQDPGNLQPYFAIANEGRNDLTLVDAKTDVVVNAPVMLRPLAIPFQDRPALLASAPLGDGLPDLLVGIAAGSSVLQLVQTWSPANGVDADVATGQAVDLGADVLRVVALPPGTGEPATTVRLAVSLAGRKLALVRYRRAAGSDAIEKDTSYGTNGVLAHGLDFEPADLGTVPPNPALAYPGDGDHLYAATLDPIGPGAVFGVAEVDLLAPAEPWPVRALDARAPTRLVAAARLQERRNDLPVTGDPGAIDPGPGAFTGQLSVPRIYAILDEGSCGIQHRIDCGIVTLDPDKVPAAGDDNIPEDWAGMMPYRAPIRALGRPVALAVSPPPQNPPPNDTYSAAYMHLALGSAATVAPVVATTAVGVVAGESGTLEFFDLGRFKVASTSNAAVSATTSVTVPRELNRLWLQDLDTGSFVSTDTSDAASAVIHLTPGYAQDEQWTVTYQGALPDLKSRSAEAGLDVGGSPWLAVQFGDGKPGDANRRPSLNQVARLYHPALGVRVGDIVAIKADSLTRAGVTGCIGLPPAGTAAEFLETAPKEFETEVTELLPPTEDYPGGAVLLKLRTKPVEEGTPAAPPEWTDCWTAFTAALAPAGAALQDLVVTFYAGDLGDGHLLLTGNQLGYAGRPQVNVPYALTYQDEDALAAACPLADWDGSYPLASSVQTCGGAGCDRNVCEQLVLARKARRRYHLAEDCSSDEACLARYPAPTFQFPLVNGPALSFRVGHEVDPAALTSTRTRGLLTLQLSTTSGATSLVVNVGGPVSNPSGAMAFDRTRYVSDSGVGYRFLVTYPGNQVADVSPSVNPVTSTVIR